MKKVLKVLLRILIVIFVLLFLTIAVGAGYFYYTRWAKDKDEIVTYSGDKQVITSKKIELEPTVTCLFMGVNGALTDFIMLGKYDPNTREVNLISIPRDTKVETDFWDKKINSQYARGYKVENTINVVEKLTGVEIDYYVLFKTKVLRDLVDAVGGVTVTVPFNMNYDDPYQDLYIHLKKGTQRLNGKQAEQFVRYRKSNDGKTGYALGDVGRIKTQQEFIKAMISRCLEPQNLIKAGDLVDIVLKNTQTNITTDIATQYIDDAVAFKKERVRIETLPGEGRMVDGVSYFIHNEEEAKKLINEMFNKEATIEEVEKLLEEESGNGLEETLKIDFSGDIIDIEVLNNGASPVVFNEVVEKLNASGYNVVRVGNINEDSNLSTIKCHVASEQALEALSTLSKVVGIEKLETDYYTEAEVAFTVVLGPKYEL